MRPCPQCGSDERTKIKAWDATPRGEKDSIRVEITIWECSRCGHRYRTAERTWKKSTESTEPIEPIESEEDFPARLRT